MKKTEEQSEAPGQSPPRDERIKVTVFFEQDIAVSAEILATLSSDDDSQRRVSATFKRLKRVGGEASFSAARGRLGGRPRGA
jgi:hypothetical protein